MIQTQLSLKSVCNMDFRKSQNVKKSYPMEPSFSRFAFSTLAVRLLDQTHAF